MQSGKRGAGAEGRQGAGADSRRVSTESRRQSLQSRQASLKSLGSLERRPQSSCRHTGGPKATAKYYELLWHAFTLPVKQCQVYVRYETISQPHVSGPRRSEDTLQLGT